MKKKTKKYCQNHLICLKISIYVLLKMLVLNKSKYKKILLMHFNANALNIFLKLIKYLYKEFKVLTSVFEYSVSFFQLVTEIKPFFL